MVHHSGLASHAKSDSVLTGGKRLKAYKSAGLGLTRCKVCRHHSDHIRVIIVGYDQLQMCDRHATGDATASPTVTGFSGTRLETTSEATPVGDPFVRE
eukprot:COSAG02_NODE_36628_length_452_cov_1.016997_1_plen_97_part_10